MPITRKAFYGLPPVSFLTSSGEIQMVILNFLKNNPDKGYAINEVSKATKISESKCKTILKRLRNMGQIDCRSLFFIYLTDKPSAEAIKAMEEKKRKLAETWDKKRKEKEDD